MGARIKTGSARDAKNRYQKAMRCLTAGRQQRDMYPIIRD